MKGIGKTSSYTPMMRQYLEIKKSRMDGFLFFRLGDFYEMFFDDAIEASKILNIALTSREAGKGNKVPMCGIPYHAAEGYIAKLIRSGKKVYICEQVEDPKLAKGIVAREITEVITPGTVLDDNVLDKKRNNYLASICYKSGNYGLAYADLSTGEFKVTEIKDIFSLKNEIFRISPSELLIPKAIRDIEDFKREVLERFSFSVTEIDDWVFDFNACYQLLLEHFGTSNLDGFGCQGMIPGISSAGAIIFYLKENLYEKLKHIDSVIPYSVDGFMLLDSNTLRNLEILESFSGIQKNSLLGVIDFTETAMGARLLRKWLSAPLIDRIAINERLDAVDELYSSPASVESLRVLLKEISDIERITGRINSQKANARDLIGLKNSLKIIPDIKKALSSLSASAFLEIAEDMGDFSDIKELIERAIVDNPPVSIKEGGFIRSDFNDELKELKEISRNSRNKIAQIQNRERERTGIKSLKVNYNKVFGYYIEITKANLGNVPDDYIRKQTLVNSERFITPELKELEDKILGADDKIKNLEYEIIQNIRKTIAERTGELKKASMAIARLDVRLSFAIAAKRYDYVKPQVDESDIIEIVEGRHPVVERIVPSGQFVPNSIYLDCNENQIAIITGPNMAGKSTFIRQTALITLLAQVGSFVPAERARVGIVDRIFTRVGASDDLATGKSTFMVEMNETAMIMNNATSKSLIILDEIGRGTSTYDGISIAWAVVEYLHMNPDKKAKTLFATHYFELTKLENLFKGINNYNVAVTEWNDDIIFVRKIKRGASDKSYGIHVARLAGLPYEIIERAREILADLESENFEEKDKRIREIREKKPAEEQLVLFETKNPYEKVIEKIKEIDINRITPIDALNKLNKIIEMVKNGKDKDS